MLERATTATDLRSILLLSIDCSASRSVNVYWIFPYKETYNVIIIINVACFPYYNLMGHFNRYLYIMCTQSERTYIGFTLFFPKFQKASTHKLAKPLTEQSEYLFSPLLMSFYIAFWKKKRKYQFLLWLLICILNKTRRFAIFWMGEKNFASNLKRGLMLKNIWNVYFFLFSNSSKSRSCHLIRIHSNILFIEYFPWTFYVGLN